MTGYRDKKNRKSNRFLSICMLLIMAVSLIMTGCGSRQTVSGEVLDVYSLDGDNNSIISRQVAKPEDISGTSDELDYLISELEQDDTDNEYHAPLGSMSGYSGYQITEDGVTINFTDDISSLPVYMTVLIRAAVTRTLTQVDGVDTVTCMVNGNPMTDSTGQAIGPMSADMFIDNAGAQINPDEHTVLTLYFASADGNSLVKINRSVTYSSNISLDKLVVEQLILGPQDGEDAYPVIDPETKINSVTTQDGTCYVNLDGSFTNTVNNVSTDVALYSIVNSLSELGTVNKVQFYVDGEADVSYRETVSLTTQFVRNLDLIK